MTYLHKTNIRSRSVRISVNAQGVVVVTTPPRFPVSQIPRYIDQAKAWIEEARAKQRSKPVLLSDMEVMVFGEMFNIIPTDHQDGSVHIHGKELHIAAIHNTHTGREELLESWLKNRAIEYIIPRVAILGKQMGVVYHDVRFKQQKTRWGSCSSQKNLNFNWRLIHAPKGVIDYVLIHELAHTVHMNHGRRFWELVARFDPDHPLHRGWLRRFGSTED